MRRNYLEETRIETSDVQNCKLLKRKGKPVGRHTFHTDEASEYQRP